MDELDLFREDSEEQLQSMENALMDANDNGVDEEKIGAIFRGMHTIKGSAGMFNFEDVVSFTHVAENLMSEVRNGKIELTKELISLFLEVKDHVQKLIELAINNEKMSSEDEEIHNKLLLILNSFLPENSNTPKIEKKEVVKESNNSEDDDFFHISIRLHEDFLESGMDILSIFHYLNKIGEIVINIPIIKNIPNLNDIIPIKTYIGFEIDFMGEVTQDEVLESFEFIEDDIDLLVFRHNNEEEVKKFIENLDKDILTTLTDNGLFEEFAPKPPKKEISQKSSSNSKNSKTEKSPAKHQKVFTLRVESSKVDNLMNQISEMVIANSRLSQLSLEKNDTDLEEASATMDSLLEEIRNSVMSMRMVPVEESFIKFKRIVNDTAKKLGKDIEFVITGGDTELDKSVIEKINDPLVHMLRNSIDHGIEVPDIRVANGKNPKGRVELRTYPDSGTIVIEITDDGAGLDTEKLLQKAIEKGIVPEDNNLTRKEIFNLIFNAGFSMAKKVSDISGRGVGMDVVRKNIEDLRGNVDIESTLGKGTKFTIRLPLTLAIIDGFLVQVGDSKFVVPLDMIQECIELTKEYREKMKGNNFINLRGEILPIFDVREYFEENESQFERENIVVVKYANHHIGILVDELFGEYHTVIKPLGDIFTNVPGIAGGSILGTGEVTLIFDIPALISYYIESVKK